MMHGTYSCYINHGCRREECRAVALAYKRLSTLLNRGVHQFDPEPIVKEVRKFGASALSRKLAERFPYKSAKTWERLLAGLSGNGRCFVTVRIADELAIGLGLHPSILWPGDWGLTAEWGAV